MCGRHLSNWGADVCVYTTKTIQEFTQVPRKQLMILENMGLPINLPDCLENEQQPHLIIDGIIGYSLRGNPRGGAKQMIEWANERSSPKLALDVPSGLDLTTGAIHSPTIQADATMTLALPKEGLIKPGVKNLVGELYLADISVPPSLYARSGLDLQIGALFTESEILRIA